VGDKQCKELVVIKHVKRSLERQRRRWDDNDNMNVIESRCEIVNRFNFGPIGDLLWAR
jgi:hypothetical protein